MEPISPQEQEASCCHFLHRASQKQLAEWAERVRLHYCLKSKKIVFLVCAYKSLTEAPLGFGEPDSPAEVPGEGGKSRPYSDG